MLVKIKDVHNVKNDFKNNTDIVISVIIVNYKTENLTVDVIDSIYKNTKEVSIEIIVVDNNSNDNSQLLIEERFGGKIKYIGLNENLGFGKANNEGSKIAVGKYLLFLNSDTLLVNNAIYILTAFMENNLDVGICGGNLYTNELKPAHSCMPVLPSLFLELDSVFAHLFFKLNWGTKFDFNNTEKPKEVADIVGADLMIRANLFNEIGGFDPDFFLYNEETELAYRVKKSGYLIYSVPDAKIIHLEGKSMSSDISKRKFALISRKIYYKKTRKYAYRSLIDLIFIIKCILGIIISIIKLNFEYVNYWHFALKKGMIELW